MEKLSTNKGYTILETMISVAIFLLIVEFGMGSLLGANNLHQKSQSMRSAFDSLSFVMDDLSRSLRTGYDYQCFRKNVDPTLSPGTLSNPRSCSDGWAIAFEADVGDAGNNNDQVAYYISGGKIWKSTNGAASFIQLTSDEIVIDVVSGFSVLGAERVEDSSNRQQPLVTIRLSGTITYRSIITPFQVQTTVSQRLVDI